MQVTILWFGEYQITRMHLPKVLNLLTPTYVYNNKFYFFYWCDVSVSI